MTATTDQDGFYQLKYKHTGKAATFTVAIPQYSRQQSVTLKANGYALVLFESLSELMPSRSNDQVKDPSISTVP